MNTSLISAYRQLENSLHEKLGRLAAMQSEKDSAEKRIKELENKLDTSIKSSLFLQSISDLTRVQVIEKINAIVTDALQKVKDPSLEFKMLLSTERNQLDLKFVVYDKVTNKEFDILESCGGGIADLVAFALRVSLLLKFSPRMARIMILDEAGKFISAQDQENFGEFIKQLSEKLNLQIIWATHSQVLASKAHKVFKVEKVNGVSKVTND